MKKVFIILSTLVIAFTSVYVLPTQKANAIGFAGVIPAGITVGAGAYVVSALALSGLVGVAVGDEYGDEINAHAKTVWANATQLSKDSLNYSLEQSINFGNGVINLGAEFEAWMDSYGINAIALGLPNLYPESDYGTNYMSESMSYSGDAASPVQRAVRHTSFDYTYTFPQLSSTKYSSIDINVQQSENASSRYVTIASYGSVITTMRPSKEIAQSVLNLVNANYNNKLSPALLKQIIALTGTSVQMHKLDGTLMESPGVSKLRESWEDMKDAGLVLPVDSATAYNGNVVMDKLNNDGTYTGIDGNIYNPSDLTWSFPVPKIRVGQGDLPDGVYVDTPALTGNPAIDNVLVNNPAIPKTTTNVNTGVTTANPDIVTTTPEVPVPPKDPPKEPVGTNPFKNIVPIALLLGLFDLLVAVIWYLIRMFHFILTIGFIPETKITNPYFLWFRDLRILGIKPYSMTINLAIFFLGFSIYKSIRRVFG